MPGTYCRRVENITNSGQTFKPITELTRGLLSIVSVAILLGGSFYAATARTPADDRLDLSIRIQDPYIPDLTIQKRVAVDRPFKIEKKIGKLKLTISGVVRAQKEGKWPLTLAITEYYSETDNLTESGGLFDLESGKQFGYGPVSSFVYMRTVTLTQRHR